MDLPKIQIIVGSTRPGRIGLQIANWLKDELDYIDEAKVETIDLAAINLPFLDELAHPATGQYSNDHTLAWSRKIKEGNGYIWLTRNTMPVIRRRLKTPSIIYTRNGPTSPY